MKLNDITIIIPTRNNLELLQWSLLSIREKKKYDVCSILIGLDNCSEEIVEWCKQNKSKYNFNFYEFTEKKYGNRLGIVDIVSKLIDASTTDIVFYIHDDMFIGEFTLENLLSNLNDKTILSATRVEPEGRWQPEPVKYLAPFGDKPSNFTKEKFLQLEKKLVINNQSRTVNGFFAPHMFFKKDWIGYDPEYAPQSREDTAIAFKFVKNKYKLITVRDAIVYHIGGKGSRKKTDDNDSVEWKKTNYKNERNFVRQWGYLPRLTEYLYPVYTPKKKISAHILLKNEAQYIFTLLQTIEPFFDEIVIVDDYSTDRSINNIEAYINMELQQQPTNFRKDKIKIYKRKLNNDFGTQTNFAISKCSNEWVIKIDADETLDIGFLNNLQDLIAHAEKQGVDVIGFPRVNTLNGIVVNDIPREEWNEKDLEKYRNKQPTQGLKNPDIQFRLHRQHIKWVGKVHEIPEPIVLKSQNVMIANGMFIYHHKSLNRQLQQNKLYEEIAVGEQKEKSPIKKVILDSVLYTIEGITKHAREEAIELTHRGYELMCLSPYMYNPNIANCEKLKDCYKPIDIINDDYITICNQPPNRWQKSAHLKNFVGFLAFEGMLPVDWVDIMNKEYVKEIWTPSSWCKQMFLDSGVKKPIYVIPHGIDERVWRPTKAKNKKFDKFTFLGIGTTHNNRKGLDMLTKAFSEEFKDEPDVQLVLKINRIYNKYVDNHKLIRKHIKKDGNNNVFILDDDLTEEEMVELMNRIHVYVSSSYAEGFGINILNALACGIPTVTTQGTGNDEFCSKDNCLLVENTDKETWSKFVYPYDRVKWTVPDIDSLKKQMRYAFENYKKLSREFLLRSDDIRENWSWKKTVDKIEERILTF